MSITAEQKEQSRKTITEYKTEIARIQSMWDKDPQLEVNDRRVADLEEKIGWEEAFLSQAEVVG